MFLLSFALIINEVIKPPILNFNDDSYFYIKFKKNKLKINIENARGELSNRFSQNAHTFVRFEGPLPSPHLIPKWMLMYVCVCFRI